MTNEKAREYFSAYSEGTLDAGLAQSFEAKLKADTNLRAEYDQFEATLKELESLRFEQIEVPHDLNDRISAAIDKNIYEKKRTAQPSWTLWLRNIAFAGLAAAAVFGAYLSITAVRNGGNMEANPLPSIGNNDRKTIEQIEYSTSPSGVKMRYQPAEKHTVTIQGGSKGTETINVDDGGWLNELKNDQPGAATFMVEVKGEVPPTIVVVPGTERKELSAGQGSVTKLAQALADKYGMAVVLKSNQAQSEINWTLAETDAHKAATSALQNLPFAADVRDGVLYISDN